MLYYIKNACAIKAKIAPATKNGANGINCCLLIFDQMPPNMHDSTSAIANPFGPSHSPPVANNFMSPIPIGVSASGLRRRRMKSKTYPTIAPSA